MKVCIDIQSAIAQRAGVGRYTKHLVEHLSYLRGSDQLNLFYFDFKRRGVPFPVEGAQQTVVRFLPGRYVQAAWRSLSWPPFDWLAGSADLFHFPNFIRPPLTRGKSVVTIHDVSFLRFPETLEEKNYRYLTSKIKETVEKADAIITDSAFVGQELSDHFPEACSKIFPIHLGLDEHVARPDAEQVVQTKKELKLDRPYLLAVGTLEPRKNISFLVDVFERLSFDGDLVIAGGRGWKYEPILQRIQNSKKANRIRYMEYVEERHLASLYAGAELFVFPSLYEGFGFTPLEAMVCGAPVVSSAGGSLPEVLSDAAVIIPGYDVGEWSGAVNTLLGDSGRRDQLRRKGFAQARLYTWQATAKKTWDVYRQI